MKRYIKKIFVFIIITIIFLSNACYATTWNNSKTYKVENKDTIEELNNAVNELLSSQYSHEEKINVGIKEVSREQLEYEWKYNTIQFKALIGVETKDSKYYAQVVVFSTMKEADPSQGITIKDKTKDPDRDTSEELTKNPNNNAPLKDPISNPDYYKPVDRTGENTEFIRLGNIVIGAMRVVGTVISVISLMVIGLRYMFGSTAQKVSYKETMVPYLVGTVMIFTIPHIVGIIYDLVKGITF